MEIRSSIQRHRQRQILFSQPHLEGQRLVLQQREVPQDKLPRPLASRLLLLSPPGFCLLLRTRQQRTPVALQQQLVGRELGRVQLVWGQVRCRGLLLLLGGEGGVYCSDVAEVCYVVM